MSIGEAIRSAREANGWSQPELAERLQTARETICRWETGERQPSWRAVLALEAILGRTLGMVRPKGVRKRTRKS